MGCRWGPSWCRTWNLPWTVPFPGQQGEVPSERVRPTGQGVDVQPVLDSNAQGWAHVPLAPAPGSCRCPGAFPCHWFRREPGSARREEPLTGPPPDVPQQCPRPKGHVNPGYPPKVRRIIPLGMKRTTHDAFLSPFSLPYEMDCILLRFHDDHNREFCESSRPLPGPHDRNRVPIHTSVRHTRGPGGVAPGVAKPSLALCARAGIVGRYLPMVWRL